MPPKITVPVKERIEQLSMPVTECGCHIWLAGMYRAGYGCLMIDRKSFYAHRLAWEVANGPVPPGLCVLHRCDIRSCVNPDHLFLGTRGDNVADMIAKGRNLPARGERSGMAKLSEKSVIAIRLSKDGSRKLGRRYGVSHNTISAVKNAKTWKHI